MSAACRRHDRPVRLRRGLGHIHTNYYLAPPGGGPRDAATGRIEHLDLGEDYWGQSAKPVRLLSGQVPYLHVDRADEAED